MAGRTGRTTSRRFPEGNVDKGDDMPADHGYENRP